MLNDVEDRSKVAMIAMATSIRPTEYARYFIHDDSCGLQLNELVAQNTDLILKSCKRLQDKLLQYRNRLAMAFRTG